MAVSNICTPNTIQCHGRRRRSSGLILQKVKNSMKNISGDNSQSKWRNHGYPTAPTTIAMMSAYRSMNVLRDINYKMLFSSSCVNVMLLIACRLSSNCFTLLAPMMTLVTSLANNHDMAICANV